MSWNNLNTVGERLNVFNIFNDNELLLFLVSAFFFGGWGGENDLIMKNENVSKERVQNFSKENKSQMS